MWARSPLDAPGHTASNYFRSVTLHGVSMAYVLSTFFVMDVASTIPFQGLWRMAVSARITYGRIRDYLHV